MSHWQTRRAHVTVNETIYIHALALYMGKPLHPLIATVMAHEDATGGQAAHQWNPRSLVKSPHNTPSGLTVKEWRQARRICQALDDQEREVT